MKLDPRFVKLIYKVTDKDPNLTQINLESIPEGALWINEKTEKVFIAIKHPNNPTRIVWLSISNTPEDILSQFSFPTYNIVDIFNDNSIVAFYPFDGNAYDLANGYNGTWHGNEQYDKGIFGRAAKFDGNSWIVIENNIDEIIDWWNNNFTISVWATFDDITRNWQRIIDFKGKILIATFNDTGNLTLHIRNLSEQQSKGVTFNSKPVQGEFHHYLFVKENNLCKLYIDGKLVEEILLSDEQYTAPQTSNNLIGYSNWPNNNDTPYLGKLDQFRIFNRALAPEEIIILYNENYLIKKALSILVDKFRTYKEIVFFPAGDVPSIQTGTKFHGGQIGQVTNTKPVIKNTNKETIGKELYFPDNSAIELKFDQNITVPFTLTAIMQVDKLEQTNGVFDKVLIGLDYGGQPADGNFDFWIYLKNGKEISCNVGDNGSDKNASPDAKSIPIEPNNPYLLVVKVNTNSVETKIYDFVRKQFAGKFEFTTGNLNKLREPKLALGAWIYTSDSGNNYANKFSHFSNCGLHINQLRIFKGTLTNEEINLLLNEDKFYPVRTQYTPRVFVNKPSLNEDLIVFYNFDKIDAANKKIIDLSGNGRHGILKLAQNETIKQAFTNGVFGRALNCKGVDKRVTINNIPTDVDFITVSFWMYWKGCTNCMPFGFNMYDLWIYNNNFGFNTGNSDLYGLSNFIPHENKWIHIIAIFKSSVYNKEDYNKLQLYINGKKKTINIIFEPETNDYPRKVTSTAYISGYGYSSNHPFDGYIDQFRMYKRKLTSDEIQTLYREMLWTIK